MDTSLAILPGALPSYAAQLGSVAVPTGRFVEQSRGTPAVQGATPGDAALAGGGYGQLRARQDDLNELAQAIRSSGASLEVRKLFPPYPPEQEARMAYLDQISGLRRQIEALMFPSVQGREPLAEQERQANGLAEDISQESRKLLAALTSKQSISSNRPLLEVVAQIDPVQ